MCGDEEVEQSVVAQDLPGSVETPSVRVSSKDRVHLVPDRAPQSVALGLLNRAGEDTGFEIVCVEFSRLKALVDVS